MPRIACLMVGLAAAALAAAEASAASGNDHRRASSMASRHHHSPSPSATVNPARAPVVRTVVVGYAPVYPAAYSSRQPLGFARSSAPSVYYLPAASPNAPPFSFNGSEEMPGWHWQRVSLMQLDAEVRARRAAKGLSQPAEAVR